VITAATNTAVVHPVTVRLLGSTLVMPESQPVRRETIHRRSTHLHTCSSNLLGVDALAGLLDGPRAQGAFLLKVVMRPPWSLRIEDGAPLALFTVLDGGAWLVHPGLDDPVHLQAGDTVVARGPEHYTVADEPDRPPDMFVGPGGDCRDAAGNHLAEPLRLGVRTWGNDAAGPTTLLTGTYALTGEVGARLLRALPPVLVLHRADLHGADQHGADHHRDDPGSPLVTLLAAEVERDAPGQEAVLDRLLDLLLITALRAWFARPQARPPAWYAASADPVVGRALRLLHHNPAHPWTVAQLAGATGVSRATLARRFTDLVGEPPMAFLTGWRLALAADLLRDPDTTLGAVAHQVGYGSPFALSTAFKRAHGVSPRVHRATPA
jgi:AraC-like DNA-binding protein